MKILDTTKPLTWITNIPTFVRIKAAERIYKVTPQHYLGYTLPNKNAVIILPGYGSTWPSMKKIADRVSLLGHPTYVVEEMKRNIQEIEKSAEIVNNFIKKNNLHDVILIAHSKGGLVGKYLMTYLDEEKRVKHLISIATPYKGALIAKLIKLHSVQELSPKSEKIISLDKNESVNKKIISIYAKHDNYLISKEASFLNGAQNYEINVRGHGKVLFDNKTWDVISKYL